MSNTTTSKCKFNCGKINTIKAAVGAALYQEGELIMTDAKELTPVDTGALRSSGFVEQPKQQGNVTTVQLGFGGVATKLNEKTGEPTTSYGLIVHEDLNMHHTSGEAKFLEKPVMKRSKDIATRITKRLQRMMKQS